MKKKSRFLTGLLSAVMALSLFALPAAAADENGSDATTKVPTITQTTGSLTIKKYEKPAGTDGNGIELDGVQFTIYKVADISQSTSGNMELDYSWDKSLFDKTPQLNNDSAEALYNSVNDALKSNWEDLVAPANKHVLTTGQQTDPVQAKGQVTFTDLPIGLYLVKETDAPSQIVHRTANFLVSIPMTTEDGSSWNYNVVAEPKNVPTYAGVTLEKSGRNLVIDNSTPTTSKLANAIFKLEKESGGNWVDVENATVNNSNVVTTKALSTDDNGQINIQHLAPGTYRFVEISAPDGYIVDNKTVYNFVVTDGGEITYGGKTGDKVTIPAYNDKPDMTKTVTNRSDGSQTKENDYSIGDKIPYTIKVTVPHNIENLKTFKVTDTPTNLEFVNEENDTLVVTCGEKTFQKDMDYELNEVKVTGANGSKGFEVVFKTDKLKDYAGKTLTLTYHAKLLASASTGVDGNSNTAKLVYSNYTDETTVPAGKPKESEIDDSAFVYTFEINIEKRAENASGTPLENVEFDLYQLVDNTKVPTGATVIDNTKAAELGLTPAATDTQTWAKIDHSKTDSKGKLKFKGLSNGTYRLVETKTNDGYNLLKSPINVDLSVSYTTTWKDTYSENGVLIKHAVKETKFNDGANVSDNTYIVTTIINKKGFNLPTTGGFGTLLFSGIGALLVVGGVGVLMSTKKKKGNT